MTKRMTIEEFVTKWGVLTPSLVIRRIVTEYKAAAPLTAETTNIERLEADLLSVLQSLRPEPMNEE